MSGIRSKESTTTVALVGVGLIGAGWTVQFLLAGYSVIAWDTAEQWSDKLLKFVGAAFDRLELDQARQAELIGKLALAKSCEEAVCSSDFVQESGPEDFDAKRSLLAQISSAAPADIVIASSTSGMLMSELQANCKDPSRLVIGHPFNPVYLMPLVEVVGGDQTSPDVVDWVTVFYRDIGKEPVVCTSENIGFIANRLQEALFREALYMIEAGEATADQVDRAVRLGPGRRWAFMGPFLTYHSAGGERGIEGFFRNFGDTLAQPYSRLSAPQLTNDLVETVIRECEAAYGDVSMEKLDEWRDRNLQVLNRELRPCSSISKS